MRAADATAVDYLHPVTGRPLPVTGRGRLHRRKVDPDTRPDVRLVEAAPTPRPPTPVTDFGAWIAGIPSAQDPVRALGALSRLRADAGVRRGALAHLERALAAGEADKMVFAIAAAAILLLEAARPHLIALCEEAVARTGARDVLPEPEHHFALAALRALDSGERFRPDTVYCEYETAVAQVAVRAEKDGALAAHQVTESFATLWLDGFCHALGRPRPIERAPAFVEPATIEFLAPRPTPIAVPAAALGCGAAALTDAILYSEAGGLFAPTAVLSLVAAVGLLADRRWGWGAGIAATVANGAQLLLLAGDAPAWIPPVVPLMGATLAFGLAAGLLTAPVRRRYG